MVECEMTHKIRIRHICVLHPPIKHQVPPLDSHLAHLTFDRWKDDSRRERKGGGRGKRRTVGFRMILIEDM